MTIVLLVLFGQTVSAQDWLTAGNNLIGGEVLGSNTNFQLNIRTNSIQRLKLNESLSYSVNGFSAQRKTATCFWGTAKRTAVGIMLPALLHSSVSNQKERMLNSTPPDTGRRTEWSGCLSGS